MTETVLVDRQPSVLVAEDRIVTVLQPLVSVTVNQGEGGQGELLILAGENLSALRAVVLEAGSAVYADLADATHAGRVVGVTQAAATSGSTVTVVTDGVITDAGWSWDIALPVYCGAAGVLTQSVPSGAWLQIVGYPYSSTKLRVAPREAILTP